MYYIAVGLRFMMLSNKSQIQYYTRLNTNLISLLNKFILKVF